MANCKYCGTWAGVGFRQHDDCAKAAAQGKTSAQVRALRLDLPVPDSAPSHVCPNCRSAIFPVERREGNGVVEVLLWLFFLVPGIIYSIWRASSRKIVCPICAAPNPIPVGTPAAEAISPVAK